MLKTLQNAIHAPLPVRARKICYTIILLAFIFLFFLKPAATPTYAASSCPDLKIIFARGSGGERYNNGEYQAFESSLEAKLSTSSLSYAFDDLDYPAVSVGIGDGHFGTMLGAYISGGDSYEFGESVKEGTKKLHKIINSSTCPNTKYVIAGYSQGALVVLKDLAEINPDKLIYAATFGDPKIYLPEGAGLLPAACRGDNLSEYRAYVPDCRAYKGLLGGRDPYVASGFQGKIGAWCNKADIFCSSHFSIEAHTHYVEDGLYEDASRLIFSKIAAEFGFKNQYTSPHDTAILIDSTGSMRDLIDEYKAEALRLAEKTINSGGRVALYDYRDLKDPYQPVERCSFKTCDMETFKAGLDQIQVDGGGDTKESLLSASLHVMKSLDWQLGSTKSLVILTDAGYHSPDCDGTTFYDVKTLSKQIDPVNFYIITTPKNLSSYQSLADATDGAVISSVDDLSLLTDNIIKRFDSLPRVEEDLTDPGETALHLEITNSTILPDNSIRVGFVSDAPYTLVVLNDVLLGMADRADFTITGLDLNRDNNLILVPFDGTMRGDSVSVELNTGYGGTTSPESSYVVTPVAPKAPNTGRR
ncbi:cutinase family protein [Candidatus Saccharibacteria bacterium]|nr:cutinase family protein [Candidatus Saccharibacteria bacterium]